MADDVFEGKEGKWITLKNGVHVFIPNDKSVKEVLAEQFDEFEWQDDPADDWSREGVRKRYYEFFVPDIADETERNHKDKVMKSFKGIIDSPMAYIRNGFKRAIMKHPVYDMQLEDCIANMMMDKQNVKYMYVRDIWVKGEDTFYNRYTQRLNMKYDGDSYTTLSNYYHESGHALDRDPSTGKYSSFTYKDNEYGKTISELLKEEITMDKLDYLSNELDKMVKKKDELYQKWKAGEISRDEYRSWQRPFYNVDSSVADVIHASLGYDTAKSLTGCGGHPKGYYDNYLDEKYNHKYDDFRGDERRGSEFFAEMVDDLVTNKNRVFVKMMEHVAPKSCKVFYKIMKERYGYGK